MHGCPTKSQECVLITVCTYFGEGHNLLEFAAVLRNFTFISPESKSLSLHEGATQWQGVFHWSLLRLDSSGDNVINIVFGSVLVGRRLSVSQAVTSSLSHSSCSQWMLHPFSSSLILCNSFLRIEFSNNLPMLRAPFDWQLPALSAVIHSQKRARCR